VIVRTLFFIFILLPVILIGIPLMFIITKLGGFWSVPTMLFHKCGCIFTGLRVHVIGEPLHGRPTLLLSNHVSWTVIVAIGSVADVTFVAKTGVRDTFFVGFMASLQRTLFVDYERRSDTKRTSTEMGQLLAKNGAVLLFAEGHRGLGDHVQPFRSALVGACQTAMAEGGVKDVAIQPVTIAYTHVQGLSVSRNDRPAISGLNARGLKAVINGILTSPIKDVTIAFSPPIPLSEGMDRKVVTKLAETQVRRMLVALNRGEPLPPVAGAVPAAA
jgi:1-acyl-sn-glycerol-3-phosphate acyltransferase